MGIHPVAIGGVELSLVRGEVHHLGSARPSAIGIGVSCVVTLHPALFALGLNKPGCDQENGMKGFPHHAHSSPVRVPVLVPN